MSANGVKTVGYIGFTDAYGEGWWTEFSKLVDARKMKIGRQRALQPHRHVGHRPDAQDHGGEPRRGPGRRPRARRRRCRRRRSRSAATRARSTRRTASPTPTSCASAARTSRARCCPAGPVLVAEQLPDSNPMKKVGLDYNEGLRGRARARQPVDVRRARLGRGAAAAARGARGAQEGQARHAGVPRGAARRVGGGQGACVAAHGTFTMSPQDHLGLDQRAPVMVIVQDGKWKLCRSNERLAAARLESEGWTAPPPGLRRS